MADYAGKEFLDQATQSLQGGQFQQALDLVENAIALGPDNAEAYVLKGIAESQLSRPHEAVESFQKAMELDPASPKAPYNLAVHCYGSGQKQDALEAARKAVAADPAHAQARELVQRIEVELNTAPGPTPEGLSGAEPPVAPAAFTPVGDAAGWRQGYASPVHSLRWVENMAGAWDVIGWLIVAVLLGIFIFTWVTIGPQLIKMFTTAMSNPNGGAPPQMPAVMQAPLIKVLSYFSYALRLAALLWMIFELVDRRGPWLWLLPYFLCCCCGLESVAMALYMLLGRSKK